MSESSDQCEKKREEAKGLKLIASDKNLPSEGKSSGSGADGSLMKGAPLGFSESLIEQFVSDSLNSAITQFAAQGTRMPFLEFRQYFQCSPLRSFFVRKYRCL